jgi:hypothetical protein
MTCPALPESISAVDPVGELVDQLVEPLGEPADQRATSGTGAPLPTYRA